MAGKLKVGDRVRVIPDNDNSSSEYWFCYGTVVEYDPESMNGQQGWPYRVQFDRGDLNPGGWWSDDTVEFIEHLPDTDDIEEIEAWLER